MMSWPVRGIADANRPASTAIAGLIETKGLKQKVVASNAGYTKQALNDMLNGRKLIRVADINRLAAALGVTPNELFQDTG